MSKRLSLYVMALLYVGAGINHFLNPGVYMQIMPSWLPWHSELVFLSGVFETLLGLLLLFPASRRLAAWGIIFLLVAVFPANVQMMVNYLRENNPHLWIAVIRLPLQLVLIWWAFGFTKGKRSSQAI